MTNPAASKVLDRVLVLEMVRVTEAAAIAATSRAEELTVHDWLRLTHVLEAAS